MCALGIGANLKKYLLAIAGLLGLGGASVQSNAADEPLFKNINREDSEIQKAHSLAAETIDRFEQYVREQRNVTYMAKLRFRDPDLSEELGTDQFLYMWLTNVFYHEEEKLFSGTFFEVPEEMQKWHQVGQRLGFEHDDVFDWMINDNGKVKGAFTIRVNRSRLKTDSEKLEFDEYIGISEYEPIR
jgi:uncharacterized protein YegJ (DUF2314 family)